MPLAIRKLDQSEAESAFANATKSVVDLTEYVDALKQLQAGDSAEIPVNGQSPRMTTRRFNQAAKQLGVSLKWKTHKTEKGDTDLMYIRVVGSAGDTADPGSEDN